MNFSAAFWLVLAVVFILFEAATVTMVSAWFAAGALCALLASLLGAQLWLQGVIFLAVSAVLLALLRPLARKHFTPHISKTNVDAIVGAEGLVTVRICNQSFTGQVRLGAMEWTARSSSGAPIEVGTPIRVDRIEGVKVFVTPAEVSAAL